MALDGGGGREWRWRRHRQRRWWRRRWRRKTWWRCGCVGHGGGRVECGGGGGGGGGRGGGGRGGGGGGRRGGGGACTKKRRAKRVRVWRSLIDEFAQQIGNRGREPGDVWRLDERRRRRRGDERRRRRGGGEWSECRRWRHRGWRWRQKTSTSTVLGGVADCEAAGERHGCVPIRTI